MRELDPDNNLWHRLIVILIAFVGIPGSAALVTWVLYSVAMRMG